VRDRRRPWRQLAPLAVLAAIAALVGPTIGVLGPDRSPSHRDERRSLERRRALDLTYKRDYQYEASYEKCEVLRVEDLSKRLGVPAKPVAVADAYAKQHSPAMRETVSRACRDAFAGKWDPPTGR
jgi:hypothetical protein